MNKVPNITFPIRVVNVVIHSVIRAKCLVQHNMSIQYISFTLFRMSSRPSSPDPSSSDRDIISGDGFVVDNTQTVDVSGNVDIHTTFITTATDSDVQITQDLSGNVDSYFDNTQNTATAAYLNQIKDYASKIQCSDFQGKGTIDDYAVLFNAAAKIANDTKHMTLDIEVDGFNEFAAAADQLSDLFNSFIIKLENINIIDDSIFLASIVNALQKIWNLSETFGKFKQTIIATSNIQLPQSTHDTRVAVESVINQLNCAIKYINYFVDDELPVPPNAELSDTEQSIINNAVSTIENWNVLCEQGVSIAMSTNPDIVFIKNSNALLKQNTSILTVATNKLKSKLDLYKV